MRWFCIAAAAILLFLQAASYRGAGGFLGVTLGTIPEGPPETGACSTAGVCVVGILPESGAARAGIRPGDLIVQVEGLTIREPAHLRGLLACYAPDDVITLKVCRGGRPLDLAATLGARGGSVVSRLCSHRGSSEPWLGVRVEPAVEAVDTLESTDGMLLSQMSVATGVGWGT